MNRAIQCVSFFTVFVLGVTAGAMFTEATILVPFWKTLNPLDFYNWYENNQKSLVDFYSPLEIISAFLSLVSFLVFYFKKHSGKWFMGLATFSSILVILTFFIFFKDANASFIAKSVPNNDLPGALATWANWQWFRVGLGFLSFVAGLLALTKGKKE